LIGARLADKELELTAAIEEILIAAAAQRPALRL